MSKEANLKPFRTLAVASLTTGVLMDREGFGGVHEAAEHIMGGPIWTHEFADEKLCNEMRGKVSEFAPWMPMDIPDGQWEAIGKRLIEEHGETVLCPKGDGGFRTKGPITTLVEMIGGRDDDLP